MNMIIIMSKPAAASERLIVPISRPDKRTVARKAAAGGISMAEFARRAVLQYDLGEDRAAEEAELRTLLAMFKQVHARMLAQFDRTDRALDEALSRFEAREDQAQ
jgi:hypothetical protein